MTDTEALDIFRQTGALLDGHFILRSGLHSRLYFQCALALQHMPTVERFGRALADRLRALGAATVIAPAMGRLTLRRGFAMAAGEPVLVVEDVVTRGGRVEETMAIVRNHGARVVGVAMLVDRSGGAVAFGAPTFSLIRLEVETFAPDCLPPDLAALPAVKPGSR
jgi:orotate phosphoribosyltransferase